MIYWTKSWAQGIIVAVIIATILEMLMVNNKNKKYISTVIGIYILFSIIAPVISKVTGKEINIQDYVDENIKVATNYTMKNIQLLENSSNVEDLYTKTLKQDIANKLRLKGYETDQIELTIDTNSESKYGEILKIYLHIYLIENDKNINNVDEIKIDVSNKTNNGVKKNNVSAGQLNQVKEFLMEEYGIDKSKIYINS